MVTVVLVLFRGTFIFIVLQFTKELRNYIRNETGTLPLTTTNGQNIDEIVVKK